MRLWSSFTLGFTFLATEKTIGNVSSRVAWGHHADQIANWKRQNLNQNTDVFLEYIYPMSQPITMFHTNKHFQQSAHNWGRGFLVSALTIYLILEAKFPKSNWNLQQTPQNKAAFTVCKRNSIEMHAARKAVAQMRPSFWGFAVRLWLEPMAASTLNWIKRKETSLNRIM